jgi:glycine hydroxymethyltransferase
MDPSGIRIGTAALTTRGMGSDEMKKVAAWILKALQHHDNAQALNSIRGEIAEFARHYPVPGIS